MIQVPAVLERCAGIDIGKRMIQVAIIVGPADSEGVVETREYGTTVPQLEELKQWLHQKGCTSVAMESTGSYWIPVKNVLEQHVEIVLVCPRKHKQKRGEKTDFRDAMYLAHLHRHGLLEGSFLPSREIVELRDLTRRRKKVQANMASEKNRVQKVLETANVKIGNIIADMFGVSGQAMVYALLQEEEIGIEKVANLAQRRLRNRIGELSEALKGHQMTEHHRWLIQQSVDHMVLLDRQLEELEERIDERMKPYAKQRELLETIPGVKEMTVATILSEIGPTMDPFRSAKQLTSWAGICPGNNRSAGKSKGGRIKKANRFLISALCQAGRAAARKKDAIFQRQYHRWTHKLGTAKASVAVAHRLLKVVYQVLSTGQPYREPDSAQMHEMEKKKLVRHHAKRLRELGADEQMVDGLVDKLMMEPTKVSVEQVAEKTTITIRKKCPAKVCRGMLGFRARQTREQEYSIIKHQMGSTPSQEHPKTSVQKTAKNDKQNKGKKPPHAKETKNPKTRKPK